jgi:hypothetical protein
MRARSSLTSADVGPNIYLSPRRVVDSSHQDPRTRGHNWGQEPLDSAARVYSGGEAVATKKQNRRPSTDQFCRAFKPGIGRRRQDHQLSPLYPYGSGLSGSRATTQALEASWPKQVSID